jgi:hypothetical protein
MLPVGSHAEIEDITRRSWKNEPQEIQQKYISRACSLFNPKRATPQHRRIPEAIGQNNGNDPNFLPKGSSSSVVTSRVAPLSQLNAAGIIDMAMSDSGLTIWSQLDLIR